MCGCSGGSAECAECADQRELYWRESNHWNDLNRSNSFDLPPFSRTIRTCCSGQIALRSYRNCTKTDFIEMILCVPPPSSSFTVSESAGRHQFSPIDSVPPIQYYRAWRFRNRNRFVWQSKAFSLFLYSKAKFVIRPSSSPSNRFENEKGNRVNQISSSIANSNCAISSSSTTRCWISFVAHQNSKWSLSSRQLWPLKIASNRRNPLAIHKWPGWLNEMNPQAFWILQSLWRRQLFSWFVSLFVLLDRH